MSRYQSQHSFVYKYGESLIDLVAPITAGERILDLGCGSGELTHALHTAANGEATVMGCDADASMLSRAREQYPLLDWFVADARDLPPELTIRRVWNDLCGCCLNQWR